MIDRYEMCGIKTAALSKLENQAGLGFIQHVDINEQNLKVYFP